MIILDHLRMVIITPPKTSSHSLHVALCEKGPYIWCIGPTNNGVICKHTTQIPYWCTDYLKYVIVRDPVSRFISFYKHHCHYNEEIDIHDFKWKIFDKNDPWFASCISYCPEGKVIRYDEIHNILAHLQVFNIDSYLQLKYNRFNCPEKVLELVTEKYKRELEEKIYPDDIEALKIGSNYDT